MANYTGSAIGQELAPGTYFTPDGYVFGLGGVGLGVASQVVTTTEYLQRIFDDTLVAYVYFTRESTDPSTPAIGTGDTQPTNSGNLDLSNHAVLAKV